MKKSLLPLALVLALALPAKAETLDTSWFAKKIDITATGYTGSTTLANFPMLVRLSKASGFDFSDFTDPAAELRFADASGNNLDFEIEVWDSASETALVWVSVPSLSGTATKITAFFMPSETSGLPTIYPTNVWTSAGYIGVWHLDSKNANEEYEDASGVSGPIGRLDTHLNVTGKTYADPTSATTTDYAIGSYIANNTAGLYLPAIRTANWDFGPTGLSFEFWEIPGGDWPLFFSNQSALNTSTGFGVAPAPNKFAYSMNGIGVKPANSNNNGLRQAEYWWGTAAPLSNYKTHWRHVSLVWKAENSSSNGGRFVGWPQDGVYVNSEHFYGNNSAPVTTYAATLANGFKWDTDGMYVQWATSGTGFTTKFDELRIRAVETKPDWARANYDTQNKDVSFLTYGAVENVAVVTWDVGTNGGTMVVDGNTVSTSVMTKVPSDGILVTPGTPSKDNAFFVGWNTAAAATDGLTLDNVSVSDNTTLYAIFADSLVCWFDEDGTTALNPATTGCAAGARPTRDDPVKPNTLYDRYTFQGWTPVAGGPTNATAELPVVVAGSEVSYKAVYSVEHSDKPALSFVGVRDGVVLTVDEYDGNSTLKNFPVLVRISESGIDGFHYADMRSSADGADLLFLDSDGNGLPFEIDTWETNGTSLVWVTLPELRAGTQFFMGWDSAATGKDVCDDNSWTDYTGVWHMNDPGDAYASVADSTTNALDGTAVASSQSKSDGKIGKARLITTYKENKAGQPYDSGVTVDFSGNPAKIAAVDEIGRAHV